MPNQPAESVVERARGERELAMTPEGKLLSAIAAELIGDKESNFCYGCHMLPALTIMQVSQEAMKRYARAQVRETVEECLKFAQGPGAYHSIREQFKELL
jgi:hypothetical protein